MKRNHLFSPEFYIIHHQISQKLNKKDEILLLGSSSLIDKSLGQKLLKLISPLQNNPFNYRNERFMISSHTPKPKLQDIISQMQHYQQYTAQILPKKQISQVTAAFNNPAVQAKFKQMADPDIARLMKVVGHNMDAMPTSSTPAIFSLKQNKFLNEINGLLYRDNIELYTLIENIFVKFIPMFEWCLNIKC
eukprot:150754_1